MAQQQEQKQFQCTGDCLSCRAINDRKSQWLYCAAQRAHDNMMMLQNIGQRIATIEEHLIAVNKKIQGDDMQVFNPNKEIAEKGDAAKE